MLDPRGSSFFLARVSEGNDYVEIPSRDLDPRGSKGVHTLARVCQSNDYVEIPIKRPINHITVRVTRAGVGLCPRGCRVIPVRVY